MKSAGIRKLSFLCGKGYLPSDGHCWGDDHPDTLKAIAGLTAVLWDLGYKERTRDLEELLERRTRLLGRSHPDTVRSMNNFAITLNNLGETERAIALWNEAQGYEKKD